MATHLLASYWILKNIVKEKQHQTKFKKLLLPQPRNQVCVEETGIRERSNHYIHYTSDIWIRVSGNWIMRD